MNKLTILIIISLLVVSSVMVSGCSGGSESTKWVSSDVKVISSRILGGPMNVSIETYEQSTSSGTITGERIVYTKDNQTYTGDFVDYSATAYDYIANNVPQGAMFLCWWDYGDSIIGYTGRGSVVRSASLEIKDSVAEITYAKTEADRQKFIAQDCVESNDKIVDVATALLASDPQQTISVMNKYGARYLLVAGDDVEKSSAMFLALGKPAADTSGLVVGKAVAGGEIAGFKKVYSSGGVNIYEIA